jgi:hypothetical protein
VFPKFAKMPIARKLNNDEKVFILITIVIFSFFAMIISWVFYLYNIRPIPKAFASKHWQETPCKIISAKVDKDVGAKWGVAYSIDIVYEYEFAGSKYSSNEYYFTPNNYSFFKKPARIVNEYTNARNPVCFVNPQNPSEAVLLRGFHSELLKGLLLLLVLVIPVSGIIYAIKNPNKFVGRR